jgi:hypothetical protein
MKYYDSLEPSTACPIRVRSVHWTLRMQEIPGWYFDEQHTQCDSVVRVKKWTIENFKTEVKNEIFNSIK